MTDASAEERLRAEVAELIAEAEESDRLRSDLSRLLTGIANAFKGPPLPHCSHSWHDLVSIAQALVYERDGLRRVNEEHLANFNRAWLTVPEDIREAIILDDVTTDFLPAAIDELIRQRDAARARVFLQAAKE